MKIRNLFLTLVLGILFTSCTIMTSTSGRTSNVNWDTSVYDFNQIHFLYQTYPSYFWNNQYVNSFGVRVYYYNHPLFLRYRRECFTRNIVYRPYRPYYSRNTNRIYTSNNRVTRTNRYRVNSGRSNQTVRRKSSTYRRPPSKSVQRGTSNRTIRRGTSTRSHRSVTPNRNIQRSRSTQTRTRSTSTRTRGSSSRSRGTPTNRRNNK